MAFCCCDENKWWYMGMEIDTEIFHYPSFRCPQPANVNKTPWPGEKKITDFKIINRWAEYKDRWINPLGYLNEAYISGAITPENLYGTWVRKLTDQIPGITRNVGLWDIIAHKTDIRASGVLNRQNVSNRCLKECPNPDELCINPTDPAIKQACDLGYLENGLRFASIYFPIGGPIDPSEQFPNTWSGYSGPWRGISFYGPNSGGSGTGDQDPTKVWCPNAVCRSAVCSQPGLSYCCNSAWSKDCADAASASFACLYTGKAYREITPIGLTGPWPPFRERKYFKTSEPTFIPARLFESCDELCERMPWESIDCTEKSYSKINYDIATIKLKTGEWSEIDSYERWAGWTGRNYETGCKACIFYWNPEYQNAPQWYGLTASKGPNYLDYPNSLLKYCTGGDFDFTPNNDCNCVKNNVSLPDTFFSVDVKSNINDGLAVSRLEKSLQTINKNYIKCKKCRVGESSYFGSNHSYFDNSSERICFLGDECHKEESTKQVTSKLSQLSSLYYFFNNYDGLDDFLGKTLDYSWANWQSLVDHIYHIYDYEDYECGGDGGGGVPPDGFGGGNDDGGGDESGSGSGSDNTQQSVALGEDASSFMEGGIEGVPPANWQQNGLDVFR